MTAGLGQGTDLFRYQLVVRRWDSRKGLVLFPTIMGNRAPGIHVFLHDLLKAGWPLPDVIRICMRFFSRLQLALARTGNNLYHVFAKV